MKWHDVAADGDVAEPWKGTPVATRPSIQKVFFDGEIVRQASVEDGGKSRSTRIESLVTDVGDAYPNDDLGRLDLFSLALHENWGTVIEVGQLSDNCRHSPDPVR